MCNFSTMSRTELVHELIAPPDPVILSDASLAYHTSQRPRMLPASDALVCRKLAAARELLLRDLTDQMQAKPILGSPDMVREWLRLHCAHLEYEVFIVLCLDVRNRLIEAEQLFRGTLTQTSVYPREVVKSALARNAASIMVAHNHPSGNPEPSAADCTLTQQIKSVLALVEVRVLDHFIVAGDSILSFAEQGLL